MLLSCDKITFKVSQFAFIVRYCRVKVLKWLKIVPILQLPIYWVIP